MGALCGWSLGHTKLDTKLLHLAVVRPRSDIHLAVDMAPQIHLQGPKFN